MEKLRVFVVEDDSLYRSGLEMVIQAEADMRVVGSAGNGSEALTGLQQVRPDIVILDLQMPGMDGIACIKEIRRLYADLPILILTTFNEEEYIFQGMAYGANGYLLKTLEFEKLVQTIRDAANHQFVMPAEVTAKVARYVLNQGGYLKQKGLARFFEQNPHYTLQERKMIQLLLDRLSNREIAGKLHLTEGTIKNKLTVIYEKLGVQNRPDAIRWLDRAIEALK